MDAWDQEFKGRSDRPKSLFDFFDYAARHRPSGEEEVSRRDNLTVVRYTARLLSLVGENPSVDRFYEWAKKWEVQIEEVDAIIADISRPPPARLVIDLAVGCEARLPSDPATEASGVMFDGLDQVGDRVELRIGSNVGALEAAVVSIYTQAVSRRPVGQIDFIVAAAELGSVSAAEIEVPIGVGIAVSQPIGQSHFIVVRSGDRLYRLPRTHSHPGEIPPPTWIGPASDPAELFQQATDHGPSIGLRWLPDDPDGWSVAAAGAFHIVWHRSNALKTDHESQIERAWHLFPGCLSRLRPAGRVPQSRQRSGRYGTTPSGFSSKMTLQPTGLPSSFEKGMS